MEMQWRRLQPQAPRRGKVGGSDCGTTTGLDYPAKPDNLSAQKPHDMSCVRLEQEFDRLVAHGDPSIVGSSVKPLAAALGGRVPIARFNWP